VSSVVAVFDVFIKDALSPAPIQQQPRESLVASKSRAVLRGTEPSTDDEPGVSLDLLRGSDRGSMGLFIMRKF
jgi:hypothetical protein